MNWHHKVFLLCLKMAVGEFSIVHGLSTQNRSVQGRRVHRTHLSLSDESSPFTYSIISTMDLDPSKDNFLATQVWPSARVAAAALKHHSHSSWSVCELGCGPGLPSIVAASMAGRPLVVATDLDEFALKIVKSAGVDQNLDNLTTQKIDITQEPEEIICQNQSWFNKIDLFVMADVFEDAEVAKGAAALTKYILNGKTSDANGSRNPRVWVFAQSDRAQREVYLKSLHEIYPATQWESLEFNVNHGSNRLWLVDLDEIEVNY
jgi:hypothetical protein